MGGPRRKVDPSPTILSWEKKLPTVTSPVLPWGLSRFVAELRLLPDLFKMPKVKPQKRNSAQADAMAKTKAAHSIFKMNTDIGQHVLKNPGIAEQ